MRGDFHFKAECGWASLKCSKAPGSAAIHLADVIPLEGIHKAFRHAVGLRTADRRMDRRQTQLSGNGMRLMSTASTVIVAKELQFQDSRIGIDIAKPRLHASVNISRTGSPGKSRLDHARQAMISRPQQSLVKVP
jgi:hypothetical protein